METLDSAVLLGLLPHRHPFLLVDRVEIVEPGRRVVGFKRVTSNEWWMEGATPLAAASFAMPHALVLEALAQTSGALVRDLLDGADRALAYFMGASRVRLRQAARAGDELKLDVSLVKWRRGICRARGAATVQGRVVLTAELTTAVQAG
ncbi:MAG: beta-hydroxyacyl-ACP dehydratase [Gemmatimonadota bacterium]|nr:beta-hydroxyacyl-ACP dehydratase [Gemmatimonadota bacterium]